MKEFVVVARLFQINAPTSQIIFCITSLKKVLDILWTVRIHAYKTREL